MNEFYQNALEYAARGWSIIPIGVNKKPPAWSRWKSWQTKRPTPDMLARLFKQDGIHGLAVICGEVSENLVVRDFDVPEAYQRWRDEHTQLSTMLPMVVTSRGRHVYFRSQVHRIIEVTTNGVTEGELRGSGYVLLPPSRHPDGTIYKWATPLSGKSLPVLDPVKAGLLPQSHVCQLETETSDPSPARQIMQQSKQSKQKHTEQTDDIKHGLQKSELLVDYDSPQFKQLLDATNPKGPGTRNRCLFNLARGLKTMPHLCEGDVQSLRPIVKLWHDRALPVIRTKPFEESWIDFVQAWEKVIFPLGINVLDQILERAKKADVPNVALNYNQPAVRLLISLCRELQTVAGDAAFFLGSRTAGRLLQVDHVTAWRWLRLLEIDEIITVVKRGKPNGYRASRFRYNK